MRKQQPVQYTEAAARYVDDPRSASSLKDPFVVDILHGGDVITTASTTSSYQDNFHDEDKEDADAAACDWQYVWGEVR